MEYTKLIIDWANLPTYNTIMSLAVGVALISIANTGRNLVQQGRLNYKGWSMNFGILGCILFITGAHMTLTWPLGVAFPYDNIIFGEPCLAFGILLLYVSYYFAKNEELLKTSETPLKLICTHFSSLNILFYALGLMLTAIFFAGVDFQFFAAPKEEPISGYFSKWPWLEAWGMSLVFLGVGINSTFTARFFYKAGKDSYCISAIDKLLYIMLKITGVFLLLFGALNYYTHIGLILNTMK